MCPEWLSHDRAPLSAGHKGDKETLLRLSKLIDLNLKISDLQISIAIAIVDDLARSLIVRTAYWEYTFESLLYLVCKLEHSDGRKIGILNIYEFTVCTIWRYMMHRW